MKLIVSGDSWTFGSEIRDPSLPPSVMDWDRENDHYRIPRIWPTKLGNLLGTDDVTNLSYPASSNDRIVRVTKNHIVENFINENKPTDQIFLVVGFTSPERKDFYYKDHDTDNWITIWPMWDSNYRQKPLMEFHRMYVRYMWNPEEYVNRYVNQVLDLQNFCKVYGIRYLFFQAFYQHKDLMIENWKDSPYTNKSPFATDAMTWNLVDQARFMNKNDRCHSFHNYIMEMDRMLGTRDALITQHPSEKAHTWWAKKIKYYCEENKI